MLESTSRTTEDVMAMIAGGPAVEENKGELSVCVTSGFLEYVEPLPQFVAGVERFQFKAAWREAMKSELDRQKPTGT